MTQRQIHIRQADREARDFEAARETDAAERMAHLMGFCDPQECPLCKATGAAIGKSPVEVSAPNPATGWPTFIEGAAAPSNLVAEELPESQRKGSPPDGRDGPMQPGLQPVAKAAPLPRRIELTSSSGSRVESDDPAVPRGSKNPYEAQRRAEKVVKLADSFAAILREQHLSFDRIVASKLTDEFWQALASRARVRAPSAETRRLVIERMCERCNAMAGD